uniref:Uncharacterized protein n=1 Tax=Romanomermis culicivorax TaxID=13658 RepID=A0A915HJL5_ROMCU
MDIECFADILRGDLKEPTSFHYNASVLEFKKDLNDGLIPNLLRFGKEVFLAIKNYYLDGENPPLPPYHDADVWGKYQTSFLRVPQKLIVCEINFTFC